MTAISRVAAALVLCSAIASVASAAGAYVPSPPPPLSYAPSTSTVCDAVGQVCYQTSKSKPVKYRLGICKKYCKKVDEWDRECRLACAAANVENNNNVPALVPIDITNLAPVSNVVTCTITNGGRTFENCLESYKKTDSPGLVNPFYVARTQDGKRAFISNSAGFFGQSSILGCDVLADGLSFGACEVAVTGPEMTPDAGKSLFQIVLIDDDRYALINAPDTNRVYSCKVVGKSMQNCIPATDYAGWNFPFKAAVVGEFIYYTNEGASNVVGCKIRGRFLEGCKVVNNLTSFGTGIDIKNKIAFIGQEFSVLACPVDGYSFGPCSVALDNTVDLNPNLKEIRSVKYSTDGRLVYLAASSLSPGVVFICAVEGDGLTLGRCVNVAIPFALREPLISGIEDSPLPGAV